MVSELSDEHLRHQQAFFLLAGGTCSESPSECDLYSGPSSPFLSILRLGRFPPLIIVPDYSRSGVAVCRLGSRQPHCLVLRTALQRA